ncbi:MAG: GYD domain-containing protein [Acidobacteria bacterium]|nr:GYD domain-containing protein [Acidobacteriota bacterium]
MAKFLIQVAYTPEAWKALIANPQDRLQVLKPVIGKLGGTMEQGWFTFGEYDLAAILDVPGNVEAAAFSLAAAAGGACKAIKTTPLLTTAEGLEAMKRAAACGYKPPKGAGA